MPWRVEIATINSPGEPIHVVAKRVLDICAPRDMRYRILFTAHGDFVKFYTKRDAVMFMLAYKETD